MSYFFFVRTQICTTILLLFCVNTLLLHKITTWTTVKDMEVCSILGEVPILGGVICIHLLYLSISIFQSLVMLLVPKYLTPNGEELIGFAGMTVSDLRLQFQDCWLVEAADPTIIHSAGDYVLVPGVLYQVILTAATQEDGTCIPLAHFSELFRHI